MPMHTLSRPYPILMLALVAFGLGAAPAAAQTFRACRVPDVGAIYMIGVAGTPSACLDPLHVEFSWTEGGQVADGAVTTEKIAAGAVTDQKIADYSISNQHIVPESIEGTAIAAGTIQGSDIANGAVGLFDMAANSVGPEALGLEIVEVVEGFAESDDEIIFAECPSGKRLIGGGYRMGVMNPYYPDAASVTQNGPDSDTRWLVRIDWPASPRPTSWVFTAYAICIIDGS